MRNTEVFIMLYTSLVFPTIAILSLVRVEAFEIYVALFAIEFLVASELASPFGPTESRRRILIGMSLLVIFTGIILARIFIIFR